jgi:hypothetical protein
MVNATEIDPGKKRSLHALEATIFFLADVQTGLGPFLAAYLAGAAWEPGHVGTERNSRQRDQDNALVAWPEHGLLGTQLGPNKNGKKW